MNCLSTLSTGPCAHKKIRASKTTEIPTSMNSLASVSSPTKSAMPHVLIKARLSTHSTDAPASLVKKKELSTQAGPLKKT